MDADPEPQLVRVFDLSASTTRLEPWLRDFETNLGRTIKTADYHKPFHMAHRERGYNPQAPELGYIRRDFAPANNSVLAEIARATSAFPAAFEPRLIERTEATNHLLPRGQARVELLLGWLDPTTSSSRRRSTR